MVLECLASIASGSEPLESSGNSGKREKSFDHHYLITVAAEP